MPHTLTKTVFKFDELDDRAKERARQWWRQCETAEFDTDCVYEDAAVIGDLMGISLRQRPVKLVGGGTRLEADYDYQMSNDNVDENIRVNEYDFDEEGEIA